MLKKIILNKKDNIVNQFTMLFIFSISNKEINISILLII